MNTIGNETNRFIVVEVSRGYKVRDMLNGRDLRYSYSNPPLYGTATTPADRWNNYYSARGFAQKMAARNDPLPWIRPGH